MFNLAMLDMPLLFNHYSLFDAFGSSYRFHTKIGNLPGVNTAHASWKIVDEQRRFAILLLPLNKQPINLIENYGPMFDKAYYSPIH
jgi:hypothetical protein